MVLQDHLRASTSRLESPSQLQQTRLLCSTRKREISLFLRTGQQPRTGREIGHGTTSWRRSRRSALSSLAPTTGGESWRRQTRRRTLLTTLTTAASLPEFLTLWSKQNRSLNQPQQRNPRNNNINNSNNSNNSSSLNLKQLSGDEEEVPSIVNQEYCHQEQWQGALLLILLIFLRYKLFYLNNQNNIILRSSPTGGTPDSTQHQVQMLVVQVIILIITHQHTREAFI